MKNIIIIAMAAFCLIVTTFSANAQRNKKYMRKNIDANLPIKPNVLDLLKVKQDKNLGKMTGTIYNNSGLPFDFGDTDGKYNLELLAVSYKSTTSAGGLISSGVSYDSSLVKSGITVEFEKINDTLIKYTAYNIPVNKVYVIALLRNEIYTSTKGNIYNTNYGNLSQVKIENAYYYYQIAYTGTDLQTTRKINYPGEIFEQDILINKAAPLPQ